MRRLRWVGLVVGAGLMVFCGGCSGSGSGGGAPAVVATSPLTAGNTNLIFVVSEDLAYNAAGDVSVDTANLTSQGLERSLKMAPFLQQSVLGKQGVTAIYALEPATHPQTAANYPDMVALETIQEFSVMNKTSLRVTRRAGLFTRGIIRRCMRRIRGGRCLRGWWRRGCTVRTARELILRIMRVTTRICCFRCDGEDAGVLCVFGAVGDDAEHDGES